MVDQMDQVLRRQRFLRHSLRHLEDVDYWRKRAGWADDDETMKAYNNGVYNTYYLGDENGSGGGGAVSQTSNSGDFKLTDHLSWIIGLASALIFLILVVKCCSSETTEKSRKSRSSVSAKSRDSSRSLRDKHADRRSRSRSRARSKSRSGRSKSRGREVVEDYKLMSGDDEDDDSRSRKSSRSTRSKKSTRSRSRSKARSKSRTREKEGAEREITDKEGVTMLV